MDTFSGEALALIAQRGVMDSDTLCLGLTFVAVLECEPWRARSTKQSEFIVGTIIGLRSIPDHGVQLVTNALIRHTNIIQYDPDPRAPSPWFTYASHDGHQGHEYLHELRIIQGNVRTLINIARDPGAIAEMNAKIYDTPSENPRGELDENLQLLPIS